MKLPSNEARFYALIHRATIWAMVLANGFEIRLFYSREKDTGLVISANLPTAR
jgi:hypothetical protein